MWKKHICVSDHWDLKLIVRDYFSNHSRVCVFAFVLAALAHKNQMAIKAGENYTDLNSTEIVVLINTDITLSITIWISEQFESIWIYILIETALIPFQFLLERLIDMWHSLSMYVLNLSYQSNANDGLISQFSAVSLFQTENENFSKWGWDQWLQSAWNRGWCDLIVRLNVVSVCMCGKQLEHMK